MKQVSIPALLLTIALIAFLAGSGFINCRTTPDSPIIAHVGESILTLDDIYKSMPPEYSNRITREQHVNYIKQWIDSELLYQEALRLKLHREPVIKKRMEKIRKDLLTGELLSRYALSTEMVEISEEMIRDYYEKNKREFIRDDDVFRFIQIITDEHVQSWKIRNQITRNNFLDIASKYSSVAVEDPRAAPYLTQNELPAKLVDALANLKVGGTSAPIKTDMGYHIVRLLDKQDKGTTCSLAEVRQDIIDRLSTIAQKRKINTFLTELRQKTDIQVHFNLLPDPLSRQNDSTTTHLLNTKEHDS